MDCPLRLRFQTRFWSFARWAIAAIALPLLSTGIARGQAPAPVAVAKDNAPPLPLKRVVLFSSSVGFFEHAGEIGGNRQIEFSFKTSDINDLLKSLVVQDRDGGLVTAVNYGSPEPITQTLRTFAIDLTASPSLAQIFQQLRGEKVKLATPDEISGAIVGIETRRVALGSKTPGGEQQYAEVEVLNLRTAKGLESVRVESIERTQFLNPKIDREFQQALDLLASAHSNDQKQVKLDFRGEGKRNVSVGYIQEAPVWKTSYRLVLKDDAPPFLQGWAIVENTTAQDWSDVQLTLVSGRPISFLMDLYQPLFLTRPFVTPEQHAGLRPRVYDQDLASREQQFEAAAIPGKKRDGQLGSFGGMGGMGGGGGFFGGPAGRSGGQPLVTSAVPVDAKGRPLGDVNLKDGVASAASAEDVGELFRYVIQAPVTLARNESAMLPIVNDAIKGEKVAIYNPTVHAKHPLAGLRLTNTTPLHLLQGPITLFDGGEYAGDARIEDIPPGSTRLVSYALDLETEVTVETKPPAQAIVALSISKGGLHLKQKVTRQTHYLVKNSSSRPKQLLLERPIEEMWQLSQPTAVETTRSLHRFSLPAEPGKPARLVVTDEREFPEEILLIALEPEKVALYLRLPIASAALKKTLQEAQAKKAAAAEVEAEVRRVEQSLTSLAVEQDRLRRNLQAMPSKGGDPFGEATRKLSQGLMQRYLTKLGDLENEIERQRARQATLQDENARVHRELVAFLNSLVAE